MPSIDLIKASDGTGPAALMTIQSVRAPLSTTIDVDTLVGVPSKFIATMGTPDLVTGIISDATATDFVGHIDGSSLEIDSICPGFTDLGSNVGDVVVIKPTSYWADEIAQLLGVNFNDDGSLKNNIVTEPNLDDESVSTRALGQSVVTGNNADFTTFTYPFPDYSNTTSISNNTFVAPSNGYLAVRGIANTTAASSATVSIGGVTVYALGYSGPTGGFNIQSAALIPISNGETATFAVTNGSWSFRTFVPAKT